jgi:hypothetical protein
VNGSDAHGREHQRNRFGTRRHVDRDAIALANAKAAQRRRHALHLVQQLRVRLHYALAALVDVDERRMSAPSIEDVTIDCVVAKIRLRANEPAERRRIPLEHAVPLPEPRQFVCRPLPERVGIATAVVYPALNNRRDETHWSRANGIVRPSRPQLASANRQR